MSFISATLTQPATGATISGTTVLNATNTTLTNMLNCTFLAGSPSTANISVTIGTYLNTTANALNINTTFNSVSLEDSNDYTFTAFCTNGTTNTTSSTTGVIISNTVPDAPSALSPVNLNTLTTVGTQTFSSTVTDAKTTGCTYTIYRGGGTSDGTSGTTTYSGNTCSFTKAFSTTADNGNWVWSITAGDGSATNASTSTTLNVQLPASGGGLPGTPTADNQADCVSKGLIWSNGVCYQVTGTNQSNNYMWLIGLVFLIVIIGFVVSKVK